ncbi:hypothetical protein R3P38DRAFT_3314636 [Favolaschia claudopus]|uniref:BTB domain-containing protein n=1 Tax=Favolaschia claudopus TaxID=2862362 RepID=A0AAW0BXN8_9AGAR
MSGATESSDKNENRHPTFYFQDAPLVFQIFPRGVPGLLYRLHPGFLGIRSAFFKDVFSLPRGPDADPNVRTEGTSDDNPILLPITVEQQDFDNLLCYMYLGAGASPKTDEFLVSLLKTAAFFQVKDGIAHVIAEFDRQATNLDHGVRFELARLYSIDEWIRPSFEELVNKPLEEFTKALISQLGDEGLYWVLKTKGEIETVRRQFTFDTHPVCTDPACDNPARCMDAWLSEWHRMRWMWGTGYPTKEIDFMDQAVAALMELQTHDPIRATVRIENGHLVTY